MPICITGMHRSGTSLVARLLNLCGLYLGEEKKLLSPDVDNPQGFWEHRLFLELSNQLLEQFGGSWNHPPSDLPENWFLLPQLSLLRVKASDLLIEFEACEPWGWKDPRVSLTLPFWQSLIPNLKVVVCLRSPLDVVQSLHQRERDGLLNDYNLIQFGYHLWQSYYHRLLSSCSPEQLIITHYESYFYNPASELDRLVKFLSLKVENDQIEKATDFISRQLQHKRSSVLDLINSDIPTEVLELYLELCEMAGPNYQQTASARTWHQVIPFGLRETEKQPLLHSVLQEVRVNESKKQLQQTTAELFQLLETKRALLAAKADEYQNALSQLKQEKLELQSLRNRLKIDKNTELLQRTSDLPSNNLANELSQELSKYRRAMKIVDERLIKARNADIQSRNRVSRRTLEKFWEFRQKVVPYGSIPDKLIKHTLRRDVLLTNGSINTETPNVLFISNAGGATERYRCWNAQEQLSLLNIQATVIHFTNILNKKSLSEFLVNYDVIILHRLRYHKKVVGDLINWAYNQDKLLLYDIDDLLFDATETQWAEYLALIDAAPESPLDYRKMMYLCDGIIVPTRCLAEKAAQLGKPVQIHRNSPNLELISISEACIRDKPEKTSEKVVIGYASGSRTHHTDFQEVSSALQSILSKYPQTIFWIIGPLDLDRSWHAFEHQIQRFKFTSWRNLPQLLAKFDINLAPLEIGSSFAESKSEIKFLETSLLEIPTIASATDTFKSAIETNETGFLASNSEDWFDHLETLVQNEALRQQIGRQAKQYVLENYHPTIQANRFIEIIRFITQKKEYRLPMEVLSALELN